MRRDQVRTCTFPLYVMYVYITGVKIHCDALISLNVAIQAASIPKSIIINYFGNKETNRSVTYINLTL